MSYGCSGKVSRRDAVKVGTLGILGMHLSLSDVLALEAQAATSPQANGAKAKSVILIWLDGGPSQYDTFDPKPNAPSGVKSTFGAIPTNVTGTHICELMPETAKQLHRSTIIRTVAHAEGAHERACHLLLTGWTPNPAMVYPSIGSVIGKELGPVGPMPPYITVVNGSFAFNYGNCGYLPNAFNPFSVGGDPNDANFQVRDISLPGGVDIARIDRRRGLLENIDGAFRRFDGTAEKASRSTFYQRAYDMISSPKAKAAFQLKDEKPEIRDKYGRSQVGQGCLLARRLVEAGVRFVTVNHSGWDTHSDNDKACKGWLVTPLDKALAALISDLADRGLLESTLVVCMGEFGRTPDVNALGGRDHWPQTGCALFAGAGVPGGQVIGKTDEKGAEPKERPVKPGDIAATLFAKLGIDGGKVYETPQGRPTRIVDDGVPVPELG